MWTTGWRERAWSQLDQPWDLVVIGGGITGAGIFREASRLGLRALLVEAHDFASGTSSRSSKLVHGGLRYLKNAQLKITLESVSERDRLLSQGKGLINRLGFLFASLQGDPLPGWVFGLGLVVYDLMARQWTHRRYDVEDLRELCPPLTAPALLGGYRYFDAQTDDARLVLRLLREAVAAGGLALNYARADGLLRSRDQQVRGVLLSDLAHPDGPRSLEVQARAVVNAAGAWADGLRRAGKLRLRPLRGSHLVFPASRLPISRAVSLMHPRDGRPVFALPWEGVALLGTTDVDHTHPLETNPAISAQEAEYLLAAAQAAFPGQALAFADVQATFSGIRPVVDTGKADPSKESREHVLWMEDGLLTVSGGKLTTFRLMARDALRALRPRLPSLAGFDPAQPVLDPPPPAAEALFSAGPLKPAARLRLLGRYAADAPRLLQAGRPGELEPIAAGPCLWAELRWAARAEGVVHLDDLLLRRVRLGLLLPQGGADHLERVREICQAELGWDDARWSQEALAYLGLWQRCYNLPG
jgi:glycerol-3-phosphate dehydrogenase